MKYNIKKGLFSALYIFCGMLMLKLAPYAQDLTSGNVSPDLLHFTFWGHALLSSSVVTAWAEFRYFYKWLSTIGNGNGEQTK